jgi:heterodisulfide reductase subunit C
MLHLLVYVGFLLINIELVEIIGDGILGKHRILFPLLGNSYGFLINFLEVLALGVILACIVFLIRRNVAPIKRLKSIYYNELKGWATVDATIILVAEILLMWSFLSMNASDTLLQKYLPEAYPSTGHFLVSQLITPLFENWSVSSLQTYERFAWWFHIIGICAFTIYITYSKHLHIVLAFPNAYYARLTPLGQIHNMPEVTQEVQTMLGILPESIGQSQDIPDRFGAKDVHDLSWKSLLDAYTCTECGRCSEVCPASITGKKLSPRKIMTDTRDRLEEVSKNRSNVEWPVMNDGKSLLNDYITPEEILACTSCNACVEACPVLINPLTIILELRRYQVMDVAIAPAAWNSMFTTIETNQAPWKFSPNDRFNWAQEIKDSDS